MKNLFRSKNSLEEEMKKALSDSNSHLIAYVLCGNEAKKVPHSVFHSLEATHLRTILSQLNNNTWYKTFTSLSSIENQSLNRIIYPPSQIQGAAAPERDIVVLKVVEREKNRNNQWFVLLREVLSGYPMEVDTPVTRTLLAIVREKTGNANSAGDVMRQPPQIHSKETPPPSGASNPEGLSLLRPPHGLPSPIGANTRISNLRFPPPPSAPPGWHVSFNHPSFTRLGPGGPPRPPGPPGPPGPFALLPAVTPSHSESEVEEALTVYTEYTLRQVDPDNIHDPAPAKPWSRVSITQESSSLVDLKSRIKTFTSQGGNIMELKLHLSEQQSAQISRLLDELKSSERDSRFDWRWAEMSLYNHSGSVEYKDIITPDKDVAFNFAPTATHIHVIAQRSLRPQYKPHDIYNLFVKPPPPPPPPPGAMAARMPQPPLGRVGPPIIVRSPPKTKARRNRSSSISSGSSYDSDSGDNLWPSDGSAGGVRRRLRKRKAKRVRKGVRKEERRKVNAMIGKYGSGSDSDSESETEEDVIVVKLDLKRGDDVVKALLELWTRQEDEVDFKGKGKQIV